MVTHVGVAVARVAILGLAKIGPGPTKAVYAAVYTILPESGPHMPFSRLGPAATTTTIVIVIVAAVNWPAAAEAKWRAAIVESGLLASTVRRVPLEGPGGDTDVVDEPGVGARFVKVRVPLPQLAGRQVKALVLCEAVIAGRDEFIGAALAGVIALRRVGWRGGFVVTY
ncbi:hypothetical protein LY78DRAFT_654372 [Colletotrichum sublineola]|nr:hypothetical protein LY78DRAFT_654372 [Colletotrichum sublineola]